MSKKIYCIASFKAKDGKEQELIKVCKSLELELRADEGCDQCILTKHIEHPSATAKALPLVFNEIWKSKEAFEEHLTKEYVTSFIQTHCIDKNGLVADFNLCLYEAE